MGVWWVIACWLASSPEPAATAPREGAKAPERTSATETVPLETRLDKVNAEQAEVPVRTTFEVRNEMGNRFRLVEVHFIVDGVEVVTKTAPKDGELPRGLGPLEAFLPAGDHVVTAVLVYVGRNAGPLRYHDDTRYRVESTVPFSTGHVIGPAAIEVIARERKGATVAFEKKPVLAITAVNRPAVTEQKVPTGLKPASATQR